MRTEPKYLTTGEVGERWRLSRQSVRRRVSDGTLPAFRVGGSVRIPLAAVEAIEAAATSPKAA